MATEQIFGEYIDLKARVPYNFSRQVTLAEDMEGVLDLYFGMGKCDGDAQQLIQRKHYFI